ncbi:sensor histidine kinase [Streptococcus dentapri]|uniref:histidine kinase n=1 Tax=Streptococcus dentapri TaxID=573564 RepID=A0ABV8CZI7_9STRE
MIGKFLKEYGIWYLLYGFMMVFFLLSFWLYHLPLVYFINALAFNILVLLGVSIGLYVSFSKKLKELEALAGTFDPVELKDWLLLPSDQAYRSVLINLKAKEAEILLDTANHRKRLESMIKMWSHQMKVPISALSLMVQTDSLDGKEVEQQLLRLQHYLETLLVYFKFSQHKDDFRFSVCSAREIAVKLVKNYRSLCLAKNLSVNIEGDCQLKTDKKWLSFALGQILDNAIKYSNEGGQITITMDSSSITIEDTGIGILEEDLPRLFEEGFTGYNGHLKQKATGLGLYMTKQILDSLEMTLTITSQFNQGTHVRIMRK